MKAYEAMAEAFAAEGVTAMFGLLGVGNMHLQDALRKHRDVRFYAVRHEGPGLGMADGWSRIAGEPGVCTVTNGPGVTQLASSLVVAARAGTPIVVFTSETSGSSDGGGPADVQRFDQRRFAEATESGYVPLMSGEDAHKAVRRAFYLARSEQRPVFLAAPMDKQREPCEGLGPYEPSSTLMPEAQRIVPDPGQLERAAGLIAGSRRPVIVAGRGAMLSGAGEAVLRLADRIGALVATTMLAKGWLAGNPFHAGIAGLFATRAGTRFFAESDIVIGVGASMNGLTLESGYLFGDARFVHIDVKPSIVMGNGRKAECYLRSDARAGLEALERVLAAKGVSSQGYRTPDVQAALDAPIDTKPYEIEAGKVDPRAAVLLVDRLIPGDVGLCVGAGATKSFPITMMTRPRPFALTTQQFGCIGQGLPTALGAAIAAKVPVVCVDGDAGSIMHVQELDTAVRYNVPVLLVVHNDEGLGSEAIYLRAEGIEETLVDIPSPELATVAEGLGARGRRAGSLDALGDAVKEFVAKPGPMLIDLRVSRRVVSADQRRLHFGEDA